MSMLALFIILILITKTYNKIIYLNRILNNENRRAIQIQTPSSINIDTSINVNIQPYNSSQEKIKCPICMSEYNISNMINFHCCNQKICEQCLSRVNKCPYCRSNI